MIDLCFPVFATQPIPCDHSYSLYGAISRMLPAIHHENGVAVHPISGHCVGDRRLLVTSSSMLKLRVLAEQIPQMLPLSGKRLDLTGSQIRLGVPKVIALAPSAALRSRLVTIKGYLDRDSFAEAVRRQFDALHASGDVELDVGKRRTLRIKGKEIVGYEVLMKDLAADASLAIQEKGIGGRRHMGCGVFSPIQTGSQDRG